MDLPEQNLTVNIEYKQQFGEVHTPYALIEKMFSLFTPSVFADPNKRWLDPGSGRGYFSLYLYEKLMIGLESSIPNKTKRSEHILTKMIWLVEFNSEHLEHLKKTFVNVIHADYLSDEISTNSTNSTNSNKFGVEFGFGFDFIIGNPPFNFGGLKKVPTNNERSKKHDGQTVWSKFIKQSVSLLKTNGYLLFIVPSIWMKHDKEDMYFYMTQFKLHKIHCLTNTEMNAYFKGHAQTPSCYFLLEKKDTDKKVLLYDKDYMNYVPFTLRPEHIIPVSCARVLDKILPYVDKYGALTQIIKTNLPSKTITFSQNRTKTHPHPNIKTCIIKNKIYPELIIEYSNQQCPYAGKKKVVLAHGMYGFPVIDSDGTYGISNRDKYVFLSDNPHHLEKVRHFLSTDLVFYLYDATRYRMKYLEKYIFTYLPNVINMSTEEITDMITHIAIPHNKNKYVTIKIKEINI